jgi:hypothetical protein
MYPLDSDVMKVHTDSTRGIAPGMAAQDLSSAFENNVDVFGIIVTDFNPTAAATFDSITGASHQFSLLSAQPLNWASVFILDSICNRTTHRIFNGY